MKAYNFPGKKNKRRLHALASAKSRLSKAKGNGKKNLAREIETLKKRILEQNVAETIKSKRR